VNLLERRLLFLVRNTQDPFLCWYAIDHVGKDVPPTSRYHTHFQHLRQKLIKAECDLKIAHTTGTPTGKHKLHQPARPTNRLTAELHLLEKRQKVLEQMKLKEYQLQMTEYQALLKKQFEQFVAEQAKKNEMVPGLLRELMQEEPTTVAERLNDTDPFLRWVAIHAAAKKWMPVEKELIELLTDPYPGIREAAHQALVRLSRCNDFGPLPTATEAQATEAKTRWQHWLEVQVIARQEEDTRAR
jgi:hypothetical protein